MAIASATSRTKYHARRMLWRFFSCTRLALGMLGIVPIRLWADYIGSSSGCAQQSCWQRSVYNIHSPKHSFIYSCALPWSNSLPSRSEFSNRLHRGKYQREHQTCPAMLRRVLLITEFLSCPNQFRGNASDGVEQLEPLRRKS